MTRYIAGRILQSLLTMFLLMTFAFGVIRLTGDPTINLLPPEATQEERAELRKSLLLDQPVALQYADYVRSIVQGDFGRSYKWNEPVLALIWDRLPVTIFLAALAGLMTLGLGVPLGILAAKHRGRLLDSLILCVALMGQSVPIFVTALTGILIFAVQLRWLPVAGNDTLSGYVLPAITLGWIGLAAMIRVTRVSMLNALSSEYIVTARSKGLGERLIVYRHALRNALLPIMTIFSLILATLLTGTVVTETMFALPGLGRLIVDGILSRDFPVVQGVVLFTTFAFVSINMIVDILYGFVDPRAKIEG